jgi:hypothetical protein
VPSSGIAAAPKKKTKGLFILVFALVVLALAAVGYFIVYPMVSSQLEPAVVAPIVPAPSPEPEPAVIPTPPTGNETPPVTPPVTPPTTPTLHASLFTTPADMTENTALPEMSPAAVATALGFDTAEVPIFREIIFQDQSGTPRPPTGVLTALDPETFTPEVLALLNSDATFFTYTDAAGTWFGAVVSAATGVALPDLRTAMQRIETSVTLKNFFLSDPGTPGTWKSGATEGVGNRYVAFSKPGFALNYAWKGSQFVISSSYEGFKEALRRVE